MADFQFRTRGQQSPQGKQRVYFTCHPDDFEKYFEEIIKEILERQDCAVFFLEPNTQPKDVEDYELRLREMQLFVVPVTTKLLTKANRAMDVEVPFAFENHIPVLPLMQEGGLDDVFNKKFGDLQYLDKHKVDPTAIPYEEKLTKYLESIIVGDELAKKVRAAFDAYIFLSYRKKDRKYAQELMKLIHSNPLCRDIAIWYDEFLTPGENFNEAIRAAIEKSELFALAVTPNLINEINYILTTEYPMARDMGKIILPAEMETTDREKLQSMYDDIPELIEKGDTTALADKLSSLFESLAIRENDSDPQHNFFIGLAYLSGIDVEVNHERALKLITGSAEQGYIPAINKLVSMYNRGDGVKRDYHKAVEWQGKLVEQRQKNYEAESTEENAQALLTDLWDLGDAYKELGQLLPAQNAYEEMLCFSEKFSEEYPKNQLIRYKSISYERIGDIAKAQGKLSEAEKLYRKSLAISEVLADETETMLSQRDLSVSYEKLGDIANAQSKLSEAEEWYRKSLAISEVLAAETETVLSRRNLSVSYEKLGDIANTQSKLSVAEELYHKSLAISKALAAETETVLSRRDLSVSYSKLGGIAEAQGRLSEAEEWYRKDLAINETLATETETIKARRDLSITYNRLGDIAKAQRELTQAMEWYRKSIVIRLVLAKETETVEARRDLSTIYANLGDTAKAQYNLSEAEEFYKRSFEIDKSIAEETKTLQSYHNVSVSYNKLGDILRLRGKILEAKKWYLKSFEILESINKQINTVESRHSLSISCVRLGNISKELGKLHEAEEWYRKGLAISKTLAEEIKTVESYDDLAVSYYKIGCLIEDKSMLEQALSIWEQLAAQCPDNPRYRRCADIAKKDIQRLFPDD